MSESVEAQVRRMANLAWAAGVLDARGTWAVSGRPGASHQLRPRITLRSSHAAVLVSLQEILGGGVGRPSGALNQRVWAASGAKACAEVSAALIPHLRRLGGRASIHLDLCQRIIDYRPETFEDRGLDQHEIEERQKLIDAMLRL